MPPLFAGAHLRKTQTSQRVVYTGLLESLGMVFIIDKDANKISIHQTITPNLVPGMTWQTIVAQIDADNTVT